MISSVLLHIDTINQLDMIEYMKYSDIADIDSLGKTSSRIQFYCNFHYQK